MTVSPQQLKLPHHVPSTGLRGQTKLLEPRPLFLQGCPSPLAPYRSKIYYMNAFIIIKLLLDV